MCSSARGLLPTPRLKCPAPFALLLQAMDGNCGLDSGASRQRSAALDKGQRSGSDRAGRSLERAASSSRQQRDASGGRMDPLLQEFKSGKARKLEMRVSRDVHTGRGGAATHVHTWGRS